MIAAVVAHSAVFALWPEMVAGVAPIPKDELIVLAPPEVDIPPAPEPLPRPALPVAAPIDLVEDVTIGRTSFEENPIATLAPPPTGPTTDVGAGPRFLPYTVAPLVLNRDEVVRAMVREYPAVLRDAGIGGTVTVFFFVDENGLVQDRRIDQSSGIPGLDAAALEVAETFRFSPALNRDHKVPVWVSLPIRFQVR
jgi:protein TonB